jgi:hypothetical protein
MITNPIIPIVLENDRGFENGFNGTVYFCDIDKTYLDTKFETVSGLISTLFDFAVDKVRIPGMDFLLKGVRRKDDVINAIYFLSASPKEMKNIISKKLVLDGVQFDGICLRDHLFYLKKLKLKSLKKPFSFKLLALLTYNSLLPENTNYVLIGDNTESDADIYKMFKEIVKNKKIDISELKKYVHDEAEIKEIISFHDKIKSGNVERIYINNYIKSKQTRNNQDVIFYNHSIEVMLDLYKLNKLDDFFIKKAFKNLSIDIDSFSEENKNIIESIMLNE